MGFSRQADQHLIRSTPASDAGTLPASRRKSYRTLLIVNNQPAPPKVG